MCLFSFEVTAGNGDGNKSFEGMTFSRKDSDNPENIFHNGYLKYHILGFLIYDIYLIDKMIIELRNYHHCTLYNIILQILKCFFYLINSLQGVILFCIMFFTSDNLEHFQMCFWNTWKYISAVSGLTHHTKHSDTHMWKLLNCFIHFIFVLD